jgi:hypothetical protein
LYPDFKLQVVQFQHEVAAQQFYRNPPKKVASGKLGRANHQGQERSQRHALQDITVNISFVFLSVLGGKGFAGVATGVAN